MKAMKPVMVQQQNQQQNLNTVQVRLSAFYCRTSPTVMI